MKNLHDICYVRETFLKQVDYDFLDTLGLNDRWLIGIMYSTITSFHDSFRQQVFLTPAAQTKTCPIVLDLQIIMEQVRTASIIDRKLLLGSICRWGTLTMLKPFLDASFDMNERFHGEVPGLHKIRRSYLLQAAVTVNVETFEALLEHGAKLLGTAELVSAFSAFDAFDGLGRRCPSEKTEAFVEGVLDAFVDKEDARSPSYDLFWLILRRSRFFELRFEDSSKAVCCLADGCIRRGYHRAASPRATCGFLGCEIWMLSQCKQAFGPDLIRHLLHYYQPELEYIDDFVYQRTTALGSFLRTGNDKSQLAAAQILLDAGAEIVKAAPTCRSALEVVEEKMLDPPLKEENPEWRLKAFNMVLEALRKRGQSDVANDAAQRVRKRREQLRLETVSMSTFTRTCRRLRTAFLHDIQIVRNRVRYLKADTGPLTAISVDGFLVRLGFVVMLPLTLLLELQSVLQRLGRMQGLSNHTLKVVAMGLLIVVIGVRWIQSSGGC